MTSVHAAHAIRRTAADLGTSRVTLPVQVGWINVGAQGIHDRRIGTVDRARPGCCSSLASGVSADHPGAHGEADMAAHILTGADYV